MTTAKAEKEHNEEQQSSTSESTVASMAPEQNTSPSPNDISSKHHVPVKISLRHRLKHFTFAWFLCTMSTGGLSIALAETPHKFRGTQLSATLHPNPHISNANPQVCTPSA
jgi:hypothetical protein